ncbi:hypothetical protein ACFE04_000281 [Oxalis oulophora]
MLNESIVKVLILIILAIHTAPAAVILVPTTTIARQFPTSVLSHEQRDDYHPPLLRLLKQQQQQQQQQDQVTALSCSDDDLDELVHNLERQLHRVPALCNSLEKVSSLSNDASPLVEPNNALSLAKEALSLSRQAASLLAQDYKATQMGHENVVSTSLPSPASPSSPIDEVKTVRSTRLLERRSKRRKAPKLNVSDKESYSSRKAEVKRKINDGLLKQSQPESNDPLRLFLWGPETRELLNFAEESSLISEIQEMLKLEKVKNQLESQFGREPTVVEWAEAVGMSCQGLRLQIHSSKISRDKLINANLRMVVHIAKQYLGRGLSLQDLLQEGSMGLMKSVEKFKPQAGCRFATYAYWWIRQSIRKAIFQNSRTIRLPENLYTLWGKVKEAQKSYIQEGHCYPSKEELAARVGISVEKLDKLRFASRMPLSMQQPVWAGQDTTYEEITADLDVEVPDVLVAKKLMRRHVRSLLRVLNARENQIIRLRFGIGDDKQKSLSEIGNIFGVSKERVRQLESRALFKLKQCFDSEGLDAYSDLII